MKHHPLIFAAFCGMATLAIVLLRPEPKVRFEAEIQQLDPNEALRRLDLFAGTVPYHDTLKLTHAKLALAAGDLKGAAQTFRQLLEDRGPSPDILDALAEVALLDNDLAEAARLAQQAQDIRPDAQRRGQLGYLYRVLGDADAEMRLLSGTAPDALTEWEVERLGQLLDSTGQHQAHATLLAAMASGGGPDAARFQRRLVDFHIETSQYQTAVAVALDWYTRRERDTAFLQTTLGGLLYAGADVPAQELAMQVMRGHPDLGHTLVLPFAQAGRGGTARFLQNTWLASARGLNGDQWQSLSLFAEITGDLSALRTALARAPRPAPGSVPGSVFLQFVRYAGAGSLAPFRQYLTPSLLAQTPLVAAAWASWRNDPSATYAELLRAADAPLSDWDRRVWMSIADDLRGTGHYRALLAGAPADPKLRRMLRRGVLRETPAPSDW